MFLPIYFSFPHTVKYLEILAQLSSVASAACEYKEISSDSSVSMAQWAEWGERISERSQENMWERLRERERGGAYIFTRICLKENLFANPRLLPPARRTMTFQQEEGPYGFQARGKCILRAVCLRCLSQYICWRNCKLTFYYSFFHGQH